MQVSIGELPGDEHSSWSWAGPASGGSPCQSVSIVRIMGIERGPTARDMSRMHIRGRLGQRIPLLDMDESDQGSLTSSTELRCITCGYDLRSLPTEESCPECGTRIEWSLRGGLLSLSDPAWVARLARGQSLLVLGVRFCLIVMVCAFVIPLSVFVLVFGLSFGFGVTINLPSWVFDVLFWTFGGALFVGVLVATIGCALVTTQDPRDSLRESSISNRNVARKALFAMYGSVAVGFVAELLPLVGISSRILVVIVFLSIGACFTVALVATLGRLAVLAARIPDHDLRSRTLKSARFFRWAIPVLILTSLIPPMLFATPPAPPAAGGALTGSGILSSVTGCVSFVVAAGILIGSFRMYKDLRTYRTAFRRCASEANTANAEPPVTD